MELTRRARYLSFHAFLLDEYRKRRFPADLGSLSSFLRQREWDLGLAVQRCPRCESNPVGARRLGDIARGPGPFRRGESVESSLGGYGLYYRTPLIAFGIVARVGTLLGDEPIPIDVIRDSPRATNLADTIREAIQGTRYYKQWMLTETPIPAEVIDELAEAVCLCGLDRHEAERDAIHAAVFEEDPPTEGQPAQQRDASVRQRRLSVAHYLTLVQNTAAVVDSETAYREALWSPANLHGNLHELIAGQWAALIAKDVWQEALCSVWSEFCRTGLGQSRRTGEDIAWHELRELVASLANQRPKVTADGLTRDLAANLSAITITPESDSATPVKITYARLEELRSYTKEADTAVSGVIVLLELSRRARDRHGDGWGQALTIGSAWQPSLARVLNGLDAHLATDPTIGDTLWWLVTRFILSVHQNIAYSKLPEFTFRFRWQEGLLHFYDTGIGRFPLASIRNEPLAQLTQDLGFWTRTSQGLPALTARGTQFVEDVLG
jgi:hypothetical protein